MTTSAARQPKGIPVGGQFASTSHQEAAVQLVPSAASPAGDSPEQWLAQGGLTATLRKTARGHSYTSPGGRRILLTNLGTRQAAVQLGTVVLGSGTHGASPDTDVASIRSVAWGAAVADAAKTEPAIFHGGQYRPAQRPPWISIKDGDLVACQPITGDYNSHFTCLRHNYSTSETTVERDVKVTRMDDDSLSVDDIVLRMRDGKNGAETAREAFDLLLSRACADPDAHPDVLAHLATDPNAAAAATRFPQYRLDADITDLDAEATKADHRLVFDPNTGNLQVRTGTATYSARTEFAPDGGIHRFLNDSYVQDFPVGYRKAEAMAGWIRRREPRLLEAAANARQFNPVSSAMGSVSAPGSRPVMTNGGAGVE